MYRIASSVSKSVRFFLSAILSEFKAIVVPLHLEAALCPSSASFLLRDQAVSVPSQQSVQPDSAKIYRLNVSASVRDVDLLKGYAVDRLALHWGEVVDEITLGRALYEALINSAEGTACASENGVQVLGCDAGIPPYHPDGGGSSIGSFSCDYVVEDEGLLEAYASAESPMCVPRSESGRLAAQVLLFPNNKSVAADCGIKLSSWTVQQIAV